MVEREPTDDPIETEIVHPEAVEADIVFPEDTPEIVFPETTQQEKAQPNLIEPEVVHSPQMPELVSIDNRQSWGCTTILLLVACISFLLVMGSLGGVAWYYSTSYFGVGTIGSYVCVVLIALTVTAITSPVGVALNFLFMPGKEHPALRVGVAVVGAILYPLVHSSIFFFFPIITAIGAAFLHNKLDPLQGAIAISIAFPIAGLISGFSSFGDSESAD